ncbi:MAG: hypothetical protein OXU73_00810 [Candidatus Campbellbacteria bacterium]|nr:hypothetical protein [Candidatus Campbellbacteria bacterium]
MLKKKRRVILRGISRFFQKLWRRTKRPFLISLLLFISTSAFVVSVFNADWLLIKNLSLDAPPYIDENKVNSLIDAEVSEYYYKIFPKKNFLIYPKEEIISKIKINFPIARDVMVKARWGGELDVKVIKHSVKYSWCPEEKCYAVSAGGVVFAELERMVGIPLNNTFELPKHKNPLNHKFDEISANKMNVIVNYLEESDVEIESIDYVVKQGYDNQVILNVKEGPKIFVNLEEHTYDISRDIYVSLFKALGYPEEDGKWAAVEYIDTRFGRGVYYKEEGEGEEEDEEE